MLPFFQRHELSGITVEEVHRYRAAKLREGRLARAQIGKTLKRLSQILEVAEEYDYIPHNPARGNRHRVKVARAHAPGSSRSRCEPISERVTPHSLRRTFASVRAASGDDPVYIAEQLGHSDPRFTLTVYVKAVKRRAKLSGAYLAEYERALAWSALPTAERAATGSELRLRAGQERNGLAGLPPDLA